MKRTHSTLATRVLVAAATLPLLGLVACGENSDSGLQHIALEPDLRIDDIRAPGAITQDQQWPVHVIVSNRGGVDANSFDVDIEVRAGGALISAGNTQVTTGLSASDVTDVVVDMSGIHTTGVFTGDVFVDHGRSVRESNETNNSGNFTVTVTGTGGANPNGTINN